MDAEEFDAWYSASVHRVIGALHLMIGDREEAQDVVQEAFVRAWDRRQTLSRAEHPEAWVRTVAWRLAVSRWRRARGAVVAWGRHGPPPPASEPAVEHVVLMQALERLPAVQRRVVVLHYLCDVPIGQIATEIGAPVGTVKSHLFRARAALAMQLADLQPRGK